MSSEKPGEGDDPSLLFQSLMGNVSPTKYQSFRAEQSNDMIVDDSDETDTEDLLGAELEASSLNNITISSNKTEIGLRKFVAGQISFNELATAMESEEKSDDEDGDLTTAIPSTSSSPKKPIPSTSTADDELDDLLPKSRRRRGGRRSKLDIVSQNLLGSAELSFARGNTDDAIKMCLEVVKDNPKAHEPYQTLGHFYEDRNEIEKAMQYHLIASFLYPSDIESWIKVAELANDLSDLKIGILCFSRAIRISPKDMSLRLERSKLYEEANEMKKAIAGYEDILDMLDDSMGNEGIRLATKVAKMHFQNNNYAAIQVIEKSFQKFEAAIVSENVNMYIELLISEKLYVRAILAFKKYCGIECVMSSSSPCEDDEELEKNLTSNAASVEIVLPFDIPIDLKAKLIVCLINLRCSLKSVKNLQKDIECEDPEQTGDLYLDVAEAYMDARLYSEAETFLRKLVNTRNYDLPAVWLRFARCLKEMQESERSIAAYYKVVHFVPNHFDARLELSDLLLGLNRSEEATEVSLQTDKDQVNLDLLLVRCRLLYEAKQYVDFASAARLLLSSDMIYLSHPTELSAMITSSSHRTRLESLKDVHKNLGIDSGSLRKNYVGRELESDEMFDIFSKLCRVLCFQVKDHLELQRIVLSAYTCAAFADREPELDFFALLAMYISENKEYAYRTFKAIVGRSPNNNQVWNIFCPIMSRFYADLRHNRFCLRLFVKHPDLLPLAYFNGHNALMSGSYKHALAEYINIHKQHPTDPFAAFCVALGFLHLGCQKFVSNKNSVVCQLTAFLDTYARLRGECQESLYNTGRAFHQLGLVHNAVHFYKRALECPVNIRTDDKAKMALFSLNREIGYNLSLIYRGSGSPELALECLRKYCVI